MSEEKCCLSVGKSVPNFEMEVFDPKRNDFGKISLESLLKEKKWVVLYFYPADFTFVCPTELSDLAEKYEDLKKEGAEVISVSTDTKFSHLAWKNSEKLLENIKYLMGADPTGNVSRLFGVYDENTGLALRGTFIISPDGKLISSEVNFYNVGRNANELARKISANAYLSNHTDEVCPSGWNKGDKTLKPGPQMVGKVFEALKETVRK
ncbi:MAG: peroxiredoxin [Elusimicrobia bacterium]|nr:peroxiredoxin [Elusimicrobiota bacterium]